MKPPPIQFAPSPEGKIAYQVVGEGPIDLLFLPGARNLDAIWDNPALERFFRRLASFSRLIMCNRRGTGLSDPIPLGAPTLEEWASDVDYVLDATGSERAALLCSEEGGVGALVLAATHPARITSLALLNCFATLHRAADYPWGLPAEALDRFLGAFTSQFGTGANLHVVAPELVNDERFRDWFARLERLSMSPAMTDLVSRLFFAWDIRGILPSVRTPTLVISHAGHAWIRSDHGRYLGEHIRNARYVERPGFWGLYWIHDVDWVLDEVETFFTGTKVAPSLDNRVLATVLFTDIVGSTEHAAEIGDQRWRWLLDEHDAITRREIERYRGRVVKSTGDGYLATFDGPARAIQCGLGINEAIAGLGVEARTGLHTGEVEIRGEDLSGIAVHIAERVMAEAGPSEVLVSGAVPPLVVGSGIEFQDRGMRPLKGVPGEWHLFAVVG
ncbi:MAG: adenylate/guanylate cyclase domain-containing protein [Nitrospiria bacterium]